MEGIYFSTGSTVTLPALHAIEDICVSRRDAIAEGGVIRARVRRSLVRFSLGSGYRSTLVSSDRKTGPYFCIGSCDSVTKEPGLV